MIFTHSQQYRFTVYLVCSHRPYNVAVSRVPDLNAPKTVEREGASNENEIKFN